MTAHGLRSTLVAILTVVLIAAAACRDQRTASVDHDQEGGVPLPLPQRAVITEQVLLVADLPKTVTYTAHIPLGALKVFLSKLGGGRSQILKSLSGGNAELLQFLNLKESSTPSLALGSCWDLIKEKQSEVAWILLEFQLDLNGKPANGKTQVIEHSGGIWSQSAESEDCKRASDILADAGLSASVRSLNSYRRLIVSKNPRQGDHFPAESDHENEQCWRITKIAKGTYLGLTGTIYSMDALSWDPDSQSHASPEESITRKCLGGIGLIEGTLRQHVLSVVEIMDPVKGRCVSSMRTVLMQAIGRFSRELIAGSKNDKDSLSGIGILMELLPDESEELRTCSVGNAVEKVALEKVIRRILSSLDNRRLVRSGSHILQAYLSK